METTDNAVRNWIKIASQSQRIVTISAITGFNLKRLRDFGKGKDSLTNLEIVTLKNLMAAQQ